MKTLPILFASIFSVLAAAQEPFPFVLPWDDASPGITDSAALFDAPAGKLGHLRVGRDGHFFAGEKRMRFLGVNVTADAGMPTHEEADKIAGRMAKFGINVVRLHFLDATWTRLPMRPEAPELNAEVLERVGYFIAALKKQGIYSNINLLVGRRFSSTDKGLPAGIDALGWKESHIPGFFDAAHAGLQREYARKLLSYKNPHTGLSFAEDPAVAFVEINNENGLIHSWLGGDVDKLPPVYLEELRTQWNAWLLARHGGDEKLKAAWNAREMPLGAELLRNTGFENGLADWTLEKHAGAEATAAGIEGGAVRIAVGKKGAESWHVQFNQRGFALTGGEPCTLRFRARASAPLSARVAIGQAHGTYAELGLSNALVLGTEWKEFSFVFTPTQSDDNARVSFSSLGGDGVQVELGGISLRPGGVVGIEKGESLEARSMPIFSKDNAGRRTVEAQRDWLQFLWETEDGYWQGMRRFLKEDLHVRALVTGTIVGCAPPNMMAKMEWVDSHAYWQHPRFPGKPWDLGNWIVENKSMVNERGGILPGLAAKRILGQPFTCTEYNHAAPNTYSSEGFLLLAAVAALQDWDAVYIYTYAHGRGELGWDARQICSFFDIDQHPTKMATLPAAAAIFVRGDVQPAKELVVTPLPLKTEIDLLRGAHAWSLVDAISAGLPAEAALMHRVALATEGIAVPAGALAPGDVKAGGDRIVSDTGELVWDLSEAKRGVVTINAPRSRAVIGFGGGKRFELGGMVIEPGAGLQEGWSVISLSERGEAGSNRWLLTATGYAENTGMQWKNAEKSTVQKDWGGAPSRVEGVTARVTFPKAWKRAQAWALDERGQRRDALPLVQSEAGPVLEIGPAARTLWFEIVGG